MTLMRPRRTADSRCAGVADASSDLSVLAWLPGSLDSEPGWTIKMMPKKEITPATSCF
jgi:hypothetical protein